MRSSSTALDTGTTVIQSRGHRPPSATANERSSRRIPAQARGQRDAGYLILAIILSVIGGVAVVRLNPLFALGAVGCATVAYVVVTRPFFGLLLYTVLFWWRPGQLYPAVSGLHLERVVGALALFGMFLEQHQQNRRIAIDGTRPTRVLLCMLLSVAISAVYAYRPAIALDAAIDFVKLVAWYLLIVQLVNSRLRLRLFLGLWFGCVGKIALDSMRAYFFGGYAKYAQGITRAIGQSDAGGDPNHLAATMSATIPMLLLFSFYKPLRWLRLPAALGVLLLTLTMSLTGSRSGLIGFFGGLLFLWWHSRRRLLVGLIGAAIIGGGLTVLPDQYKTRYETIGSKKLDGSSQGRLNVWKIGMRIAADHPITGIGIGCFSAAHADLYSADFERDPLVAHSLYVEVFSELGVLGALAFFAFVFETLRSSLGARRVLRSEGEAWRGEELVLLGVSAGVSLLLLTGIFGTNFARHTWYVYGALSAAVMRIHADSRVLRSGAQAVGVG